MNYTIPVFARFQWLNNPQVVDILSRFLPPPARGRKGYDKVWMFRLLIYKQLMRCSYRDLESLSGIDHSTFIKFRQRLIGQFWFRQVFRLLVLRLVVLLIFFRMALLVFLRNPRILTILPRKFLLFLRTISSGGVLRAELLSEFMRHILGIESRRR